MSPPDVLILEITSGPHKKTQYEASIGEEIVVGRCLTAGCPIMDPRLSREHLSISYCEQGWMIRDLDSANGTFVNGSQVTVHNLKNQDVIHAGDTLFRVYLEATPRPHLKKSNSKRDCPDR